MLTLGLGILFCVVGPALILFLPRTRFYAAWIVFVMDAPAALALWVLHGSRTDQLTPSVLKGMVVFVFFTAFVNGLAVFGREVGATRRRRRTVAR